MQPLMLIANCILGLQWAFKFWDQSWIKIIEYFMLYFKNDSVKYHCIEREIKHFKTNNDNLKRRYIWMYQYYELALTFYFIYCKHGISGFPDYHIFCLTEKNYYLSLDTCFGLWSQVGFVQIV